MSNPYWNYLEILRRSGVTNMYGASPYLKKKFCLDKERSDTILCDWMHNYDVNDYTSLEMDMDEIMSYI